MYAFRDADEDGTPDTGSDPIPYPGGPITVADEHLFGLDVNLGSVGGPGTVTLSGTVTCDDCVGAVSVSLAAVGFAVTLGLPAPGAWTVAVPADLGALEVLAFRDADEDGSPQSGDEVVPSAKNPVMIGVADVADLDVHLGGLGPVGVILSGTVTCADCAGAVAVQLAAVDGAFGLTVGLDAPGAWSLAVPKYLGDLEVTAFRDADGAGAPDAGTELGHYPGNPVTVGTSDLSGLDIDLGALSLPNGVVLSGAVVCTTCPGAVAVGLTSVDGSFSRLLGLDGPGAWALAVPALLGHVEVVAFRDTAQSGTPDPGTFVVAWSGNPLTVATSDIPGLDLDLSDSDVANVVTLSGTITCGSCPGAVVVAIDAVQGDFSLARSFAGPGPWSAWCTPLRQTGSRGRR